MASNSKVKLMRLAGFKQRALLGTQLRTTTVHRTDGISPAVLKTGRQRQGLYRAESEKARERAARVFEPGIDRHIPLRVSYV